MRRIYYRYLAFVYLLAFRTDYQSLLAFPLSRWIKSLSLTILFAAWVFNWPAFLLAFLGLFIAWVHVASWQARRSGYVKFVSGKLDWASGSGSVPLLPADVRVTAYATGTFTSDESEEYVLLRPAEYWRVPVGDHIVMVRVGPERYLYQFFNSESLKTVTPGFLLFGTRLRFTLSITFFEKKHVVELIQFSFTELDESEIYSRQRREIYLTFTDEASWRSVWNAVRHGLH